MRVTHSCLGVRPGRWGRHGLPANLPYGDVMEKGAKEKGFSILVVLIIVALLFQITMMQTHQAKFEAMLIQCNETCSEHDLVMEGVTYELACVCKPDKSLQTWYYFT